MKPLNRVLLPALVVVSCLFAQGLDEASLVSPGTRKEIVMEVEVERGATPATFIFTVCNGVENTPEVALLKQINSGRFDGAVFYGDINPVFFSNSPTEAPTSVRWPNPDDKIGYNFATLVPVTQEADGAMRMSLKTLQFLKTPQRKDWLVPGPWGPCPQLAYLRRVYSLVGDMDNCSDLLSDYDTSNRRDSLEKILNIIDHGDKVVSMRVRKAVYK